MFKSKEELKKEICSDDIEELKIHSMRLDKGEKLICDMGIAYGIEKAFSSIAERVKFYETYRYQQNQFEIDYPEEHIKYDGFFDLPSGNNEWRDWLFHLCFDGVK